MLNLEQFGGVPVPAGGGLKFLLDLILLAFVVIPVAACLDLLVRRKSSAARHHVWLLAMIALLAGARCRAGLRRRPRLRSLSRRTRSHRLLVEQRRELVCGRFSVRRNSAGARENAQLEMAEFLESLA